MLARAVLPVQRPNRAQIEAEQVLRNFDKLLSQHLAVAHSLESRLDQIEDVLRWDRVAQREITDAIQLRVEQLKDISHPNLSDWLQAQIRRRFVHLMEGELAKERLHALLHGLRPTSVEGYHKIRMGNAHDGGYIALDDFADAAAVLSFGINDDVTWDLEVANRGMTVYQYDDSVDGPPVEHERFRFFKKRIGVFAEGELSIANVLARHHLSGPASTILKIDIEHAEWSVLDAATPETLGTFSQILGEFHGFDEILDDSWFACAQRVFAKLAAQFALVHVHGNNCAAQVIMGNHLFPKSIELTLVNRARYVTQPSQETFPGTLDRPNDPTLPDFHLGTFNY